MARLRSPSYPSFPLEEAIANARTIFEKDRRSPIDREVVAKHLGYSSLNGAADKALSTLMQYGMLDKVAKGEVRVSQWAIDILHPDGPQQRADALHNAGTNPTLFRTLNDRFSEGPPSQATLRSYLTRENFNDRAIGPIVSSYTKTCAFLAQEGANESSMPRADNVEESDGYDGEVDTGSIFGGACEGDLVDWEVGGVIGNEAPMRVTGLSDDLAWVFVNESKSGLPIDQVIVKERAASPSVPPLASPPINPFAGLEQKGKVQKGDASVPQGYRSEKFDADEGVITISWPSNLSEQSVEDMQSWVELLMRRIERRAKAGHEE